jgi:3-phenylpropionate/trans-cinnamate dioxygenase ferredoxin subunit
MARDVRSKSQTEDGSRLYRVCSTEELAPGGRLLTEVRDHELAVFNVEGNFYALHNRCPHQGAPLCVGAITGVLQARGPGHDFEWRRDGELIRCPWHGWEFEIATGRSITDPQVRAKTYPVHERDGEIHVEMRR